MVLQLSPRSEHEGKVRECRAPSAEETGTPATQETLALRNEYHHDNA